MTGHSLGGCFVSSLEGATSLIGAILSFLSILVLNSLVNKDRKPCVIQYSYIVDKKKRTSFFQTCIGFLLYEFY